LRSSNIQDRPKARVTAGFFVYTPF